MFTISLILVVAVSGMQATDYILELEELYSPCTNGPNGSIPLDEAFNVENFQYEIKPNGIHVSGNVTTVWNFVRTDRLAGRMNVLKYNRGSWEPTMFNIATYQVCNVIFDKNSYWYKWWFQYIVNQEDLKQNCITTKDTVLVHSPFVVKLGLERIFGPPMQGRYKAVIIFEVFDENNVRRPLSTCFEVRGRVEKKTNVYS
ncbi:uncharacterized protein [Drosophila takahashii]|uniref:uncharacterized protein n=1 Tax=Drosophila takahashii TaxID=29030 RepID=UPI0007E6C1E5|nr:uncharacterized protein LOC108066797 [Drosophila takahashii]